MATFTVNGTAVTVEKNQKLIRYLRDTLRLTSVKDGCSEGACGTCTVLIDGKATKACIAQTDKLEGKSIVTVEGLSEFEKKVYTYAFGMAGAVQCGFCTPGMVISAKGLLDGNPAPTREEAAYAIRNNICRCTGYIKIIDAILLAAELFRTGVIPPYPEDWSLGARVPRIDVPEKVDGTGKYPDDIYLDGMGMLGLPAELVKVQNQLVGGGFGGKEDVTVQHQAALIAYLLKKPVKVKLSRQESLLIHPKRHAMGIGYGLSEQLLFDEKTGKPLNNNLLDYKLSTFMDHPHIEGEFVENPEPTSPFGTKALGEPPACPVAPAIRNAVLNATGVAINQAPITPHILFESFKNAGLIND